MREIRWYANAALRAGKSVQAFPEYGPERRGAPLRAYTRIDDRPIRRHDSVTTPDVVVVLEPSLLLEVDVTEGLARGGVLLVNAEEPPERVGVPVVAVPATRLASAQGSSFANLVMVGALAATLGEPDGEVVADAAVELLGRKADPERVREAVLEGWRWAA
jgi:pyruvate ferredoxin oxidoreductase gamma subunit